MKEKLTHANKSETRVIMLYFFLTSCCVVQFFSGCLLIHELALCTQIVLA